MPQAANGTVVALGRLDAQVAEGELRATLGRTRPLGVVLLAVLDTTGHQHGSGLLRGLGRGGGLRGVATGRRLGHGGGTLATAVRTRRAVGPGAAGRALATAGTV